MDLDRIPLPTVVADEKSLTDLLRCVDQCDRIAVDTEANPMHSYKEEVCLIQVTAAKKDFLVDPLSGLDLEPLFEEFEDPKLIKVFHDAGYDLIMLRRDFDVRVRGLADTRVLALTLGEEATGLAALVGSRLGVQLNKAQTLSNWGNRPLTESQMRYAQMDTHFLLDLLDCLEAELAQRDELARLEVESELQRIQNEEGDPTLKSPETDWAKIKGAGRLDGRARRRLRELFLWREGVAEKRNVPSFKVIGNKDLLFLAKTAPQNEEAMTAKGGLPKKLASRFGKVLLEILQKASKMEPIPKTKRVKGSDSYRRAAEVLKSWRKQKAGMRGTDPSHILNRKVLEGLARLEPYPTTLDELSKTGFLEDWKVKAYGEEILKVFRRALG